MSNAALQLHLDKVASTELELSLGRVVLAVLFADGAPAAFRLRDGAKLLRYRNEQVVLLRRPGLSDWHSCAPLTEHDFHTRLRLALRQVIMP